MLTSASLGTVGLVRGVHGDFFLPHNDLIFKQIRTFGAHTRPEIAMVRHLVRQGETVIDIGAHVGTFALPLAYSVGWTGKVLAFEPNPASVELLRLNVVLNGLQSVITVSGLALSSGQADYYVVGNRTANSGASHLSPERPSPSTPERRRRHRPEALDPTSSTGNGQPAVDVALSDESEPAVAVSATSLDSFLAEDHHAVENLSLLKIDVEGMEEAVIAGARATIESFRPAVYFEVAVEQAKRFGLPDLGHIGYLQELGYRFFRNVGARNAASDDFELEPVDEQALDVILAGSDVADLLALPDEMNVDRYV